MCAKPLLFCFPVLELFMFLLIDASSTVTRVEASVKEVVVVDWLVP